MDFAYVLAKIAGAVIAMFPTSIRARPRIEDTGSTLRDSRISLIRWGDGETRLIFGQGIPYQHADTALTKDLYRVLVNSQTSPNYALAWPVSYTNRKTRSLLSHGKLRIWSATILLQMIFTSRKRPVIDSHCFYPSEFVDSSPIVIRDLIEAHRPVVVVYSEQVPESAIRDYFPMNPTSVIVAGGSDSYSEIETVVDTLKNKLNSYDEEVCVLVSLGPAGKIIAFRMCSEVQVIDIGHGIAQFLDKR